MTVVNFSFGNAIYTYTYGKGTKGRGTVVLQLKSNNESHLSTMQH